MNAENPLVKPPPPAARPWSWRWAAVWACLYAAALAWGQSMAWVADTVSPVWPAAGVGLAAGWWMGLRMSPVLLLVDVTITLSSSLPLEPGVTLGLAANSAVVLPAAGRMLRHWLASTSLAGVQGHPRAAVSRVLLLLGVSLLAGLLDSLVGTALLSGMGGSQEQMASFMAWWLGDVLGIVLFAPSLIWAVTGNHGWRWDPEAMVLLLVTLLVCGLLFGPWLSLPGFEVLWITLLWPLGLWASLRLGARVHAPLSALVAVLAITGSSLGWGVLSDMPAVHRMVALQTVCGWLTVSGLLIAAFVEAHRAVSEQRDNAQKMAEAWMTHAVDGQMLLTAELQIESINPQACAFLGAQALPGAKLMPLLPDSKSPYEQTLLQLREGEVCAFDTDELASPAQPRLVVEFKATRVHLLGTTYLLVTLRDISAQVLAFEALEHERGMFVSGPVVAVEWGLGPGLPIVYASPNVEALLGHGAATLTRDGFLMADLTHPADRSRILDEVKRFGEIAAPMYEQRYRLRHKAGHWVPVLDVTYASYNAAGQVVHKRGYLLDQSSEMEQRALADRLTQALDQSPEGVVITSLNGNVEFANAAFTQQTGYLASEVKGQNLRLLASGQTPQQHYADMWRTLSQGQGWEGEMLNRRKSGEAFVHWLRVSVVRDADGQPQSYLALMQDLTEQRQIEQRIYRLSQFDMLTGLSNRQRLSDKLQQGLESPYTLPASGGVVVFNVSRFTRINEAEGHDTGDELLKQLALKLEALCRKDETVGRLGADVFCWLVSASGAEGIQRRMLTGVRALKAQLAEGIALDDRTFNLELMAGATLWPVGPEDTPAQIVARAETALNTARRMGESGLRFFDPAMGDAARERFALENDLRQGIADQQLRVFLQPQVNAVGDVVGWEALVRWAHPERGLLLPEQFVPIAEESDLILDLERWMFRQVFEWVSLNHARAQPVMCSINLSAKHFQHPDFVGEIRRLSLDTGAPPASITLEITEGLALGHLEQAAARMAELSAMGFHFSLDDFGTGYSSLSYIKRLPIAELKIDKVFVHDLPHDRDAVALVTAIVQVAQTLNLRVVAEGVETGPQAAFLRGLSPEMWLQGYLFGKPQPAEGMPGVAEVASAAARPLPGSATAG